MVILDARYFGVLPDRFRHVSYLPRGPPDARNCLPSRRLPSRVPFCLPPKTDRSWALREYSSATGCGMAMPAYFCRVMYLSTPPRTAFPIKGRLLSGLLIINLFTTHSSKHLKAHQQAYLNRGTECTKQKLSDVQEIYNYLLAHTLYSLTHSTRSIHPYPYIVVLGISTIRLRSQS